MRQIKRRLKFHPDKEDLTTIERVRKLLSVGQQELAELSGVPQPKISQHETHVEYLSLERQTPIYRALNQRFTEIVHRIEAASEYVGYHGDDWYGDWCKEQQQERLRRRRAYQIATDIQVLQK